MKEKDLILEKEKEVAKVKVSDLLEKEVNIDPSAEEELDYDDPSASEELDYDDPSAEEELDYDDTLEILIPFTPDVKDAA